MNTATIKVGGVTRKEGVSEKTGKPWTKFTVHDEGDGKYATFDAALANVAHGAVGQVASITYETTTYGNDLKSLIVDPNAPPPAPAPVRDRAPDGAAPDWDMIGLRKTRCALWAALLSSGTLSGMPEIAALTLGVGLVRGAEIDIFHRDPAQLGDDVPF